jgi:hypothetical protein
MAFRKTEDGVMMGRCCAIILLAAAVAGCAALSAEQRSAYRSGQEWKLSRAEALIRDGNRPAAVQVLGHIVADPPLPGITDEALYRLALLRLGTGQGVAGLAQARKELDHLAKKFPRSPRATDAALLAPFLAAEQGRLLQQQKLQGLNHALAQENGRLKELNSDLARENREFRQTLDKLKSLDLELGKGAR